MRFFSVKNFDRFQHYKDRNPPWIKLYTSVLTDAKFNMLTDREQLALIKIWVLSSQNSNKLPFNSKLISSHICFKYAVNLERFLELGFINLIEDTVKNASAEPLAPIKEVESEAYKQEKDSPYVPLSGGSRGKGLKTKKPKTTSLEYSPEFNQIWSEKPERDGTNSKLGAFRAYKARLSENSLTHQKALDQVIAYRKWCEARGKVGTETVMQLQSFFGPEKRGFEQNWALTTPKTEELILTEEEIRASPERIRQANEKLDMDFGVT